MGLNTNIKKNQEGQNHTNTNDLNASVKYTYKV